MSEVAFNNKDIREVAEKRKNSVMENEY